MKTRGHDHESGKAEFLKQAAKAFDRMMSEDQEQMITFDQMEDRALEVGSKLERFLMHRRLSEAANRRNKSAACCSQCGKPLSMVPTLKVRGIRGRTGAISFQRQEGYCPSCRKAFFPSGPGLATGR